MSKLQYLTIIFIGFIQTSIAQEKPAISPPVPPEIMLGNERIFFQMSVSKPINTESKFGFFNITTFQTDYKNTKIEQDFVSVSWLHYKIWKGLSPFAGVAMNQAIGFNTITGLQYVFANKEWLVVVAPLMYLKATKDLEYFSKVEFKPALSEKVNLYTNLQILYNKNSKDNLHNRSYLYGRIGLTAKHLTYGLGANFDYYSPLKINKNNFGVFMRADLF
ncbi:MAG: hypothetical protein V4683_07925 [Bacteroidota bacterium]